MLKRSLKGLALLLALVMIFAVAGCGSQSAQQSQGEAPEQTEAAGDATESYKIVHLAPLTGAQSFQGEVLINCAKMAVDEINANGGINGVPIEYIPVDETSQTSTGLEAVQKAIDMKPVAIIGPNRSATALAADELFLNAKIPVIMDASNTNANNPENPYTFRMQLPAERYIPILAKTVKETFNADKVAVMYANNEYAKGMWDGTLPALEEYGIEAELVQTFNDGTTDFTPQLLAIKNAGLDILFLYCYEAEQALVMRQLKELGMDNVKVLAGRGGDNPAVKELVGEQFMEGFVCSTSLSPGSPDPGIQEFVKKYEEKWKDELSPTHSNHYDSIYILADIIGRVGTDAEKICNELRNLDYKGVLGHYQCDSKQDLVHTVYSHMYENGQWKLLNELKYPVE